MIIDANIVTYWFVDTPLSRAALPYLRRSDLTAPQLLMPETTNALLKFMRAGRISVEGVTSAIDRIGRAIGAFSDDTTLAARAARISIEDIHRGKP